MQKTLHFTLQYVSCTFPIKQLHLVNKSQPIINKHKQPKIISQKMAKREKKGNNYSRGVSVFPHLFNQTPSKHYRYTTDTLPILHRYFVDKFLINHYGSTPRAEKLQKQNGTRAEELQVMSFV